MSPTILPFERKQHGHNKNKYTFFILHYLEYYSKAVPTEIFVSRRTLAEKSVGGGVRRTPKKVKLYGSLHT